MKGSLFKQLREAAGRRMGGPWGARGTQVKLAGGALWSQRIRERGQTLVCHEGWLWLTCEGDAEDHVLAAGMSLRLERRGLVVVQALRDTCFSLTREPLRALEAKCGEAVMQ